MRLSDAFDTYLLYKREWATPRTILTDTAILRQFTAFLKDASVENVTTADVLRFMANERERGLAESTLKRSWAALRAAWSWFTDPQFAIAETHIVKPVPAPTPELKQIPYLSPQDIAAIVDAAQKRKYPRRARALILFLLDTCCRVTEACDVTLDKVNWVQGSALVLGKGRKWRTVYMGSRCIMACKLYHDTERGKPYGQFADYLFLTDRGKPFDRFMMRRYVARIGASAGVRLYPHLLRHTCAVEHLRFGIDLETLRRLLGHAKLTTTQRYLSALQQEDVHVGARRTSPGDNRRL